MLVFTQPVEERPFRRGEIIDQFGSIFPADHRGIQSLELDDIIAANGRSTQEKIRNVQDPRLFSPGRIVEGVDSCQSIQKYSKRSRI